MSDVRTLMNVRGILWAYLFTSTGKVQTLDWPAVARWQGEDGFLWLHLQCNDHVVREWLHQSIHLDLITGAALLAAEPRARHLRAGDALGVILWGVNLNDAGDIADDFALRLWIEPRRVISLRDRRVVAAQDLEERVRAGERMESAGHLLAAIVERLINQVGDIITRMEEELDWLEERMMGGAQNARVQLHQLRRQTITLRRVLAPQRGILSAIASEDYTWLDDPSRSRLREVSDRLIRFVEDLDVLREHMTIFDEQLTARQNDQLNRSMYRLTLVTIIFLPLTFITGLLGINVGGIPGGGSALGFFLVVLFLVGVLIVEILMLIRMRWF
jgi:zinc transporter